MLEPPAIVDPFMPWFLIAIGAWLLVENTIRYRANVARSERIIEQFRDRIDRWSKFHDSRRLVSALYQIATRISQVELHFFLVARWFIENRIMRTLEIVSAICIITMSV